jgi:hypothetical protein
MHDLSTERKSQNENKRSFFFFFCGGGGEVLSLVDNNRKKAMDLIDNPYWNRYFTNLKLEPTKDHEKGNLSLKRKKTG